MLFERLLKNKRGEEADTTTIPKYARTSLLGAILVLAIFGIMFTSSNLFASEAGQSADQTLQEFALRLSEVINSTDQNEARVVEFPFLKGDHVLAVFEPPQQSELVDVCPILGFSEDVKKPAECGSKVCIAIYNEDELDKPPYGIPIVIDNSEGIREIYADSDFQANVGKEYEEGKEYPLIYGDCDGVRGEPLGRTKIAIKKKGNTIEISDDACGNPGKGQCYSNGCPDGFSENQEYVCNPVAGIERVCCE